MNNFAFTAHMDMLLNKISLQNFFLHVQNLTELFVLMLFDLWCGVYKLGFKTKATNVKLRTYVNL